MDRSTDASIAFSVTDNLSESVVKMKNAITSTKQDAEQLQKTLDLLTNTKMQLKNVDLKNTQAELARTKKAFEELGESATEAAREAARADFERANQNYENVRAQLDLVSKQARQTTKDLLDAEGAISKADNRAETSGSAGVLSALGRAGLLDMAGDTAGAWANFLVGSTLGSEAGSLFSGALSGAAGGAAMGSLAGPMGTAIGAALGGALGLASGGAQAMGARDDAFIDYYTGLYDTQKAERQETQSTGSGTAAQRELDAIAFEKLLGEGTGDAYLNNLRGLAAETPFEYADLTGMSLALATGFSDAPDRMIALMRGIGDAGSAVGASAADMKWMATALARMQSTDLAQLGEINMFQDRGVDVIGMLSSALGKDEGDIRSMITGGDISGREAVDIIQEGLEKNYGGSMKLMAETFSGLTSTLSDTMTEVSNAYGEGYNATRSRGLEAEIGAYGGDLGAVMQNLNRITGENDAFRENLAEQYTREALSAVLLGEETTLFSQEDREQLREMRTAFSRADARYQATGDREAALEMEELTTTAQAMAEAAYEASDQYTAVQDAERQSLDALRENTAALEASTAAYGLAQERTKGRGYSGIEDSGDYTDPDSANYSPIAMGFSGLDPTERTVHSNAFGLERVPYDNYPALLHAGERVLTAREARNQDQGWAGILSGRDAALETAAATDWAGLLACIGPVLYVGIFSSGVGYTLQILAQKDSNPTVVSLLLSLESVFATVAGALILGDRMSGKEYLGCVLMLAAVVLAQLPDFRKKQAVPAPEN